MIFTKFSCLILARLILFNTKQIKLVTILVNFIFDLRDTLILNLNVVFIFNLNKISICA
jgi:hypothetical protein